jgi:hypothetical protein
MTLEQDMADAIRMLRCAVDNKKPLTLAELDKLADRIDGWDCAITDQAALCEPGLPVFVGVA